MNTPAPDSPSPVFGLLPDLSMVDFPGRMAAVLFTAGCNFACPFCHNALALAGPARPGMAWNALDAALAPFRQNWVSAAVITGGEPTLHPGLPALVRFLRDRGFAVKLDTNGSRPDILEALLPALAYVAMDIKCAPDEYPRRVACPPDLLPAIRRSVDLLKTSPVDYEFRSTVLPGWFPPDAWPAIADWLAGARRYILQPFIPRPQVLSPALRTAPETPLPFLQRMHAFFSPRLPTSLRGTF